MADAELKQAQKRLFADIKFTCHLNATLLKETG
jgi:hypothetical protein